MKRKLLKVTPSFDIYTGKRKEYEWICPKCGLERTNKKTHKHGKNIGESIW